MYSITVGFSPVYYTVDPMLLLSGNPFKCHEEDFYLQPMIPPKRFDIFLPDWGCSEGLDAFRFFFKQDYKRIWCPDSFAPAIQNCKRVSHAAQLSLHLANNASRLKYIITSARNAAAIARGMVELRSIVFYSREERGRWRQGPRWLRCS